ncbi:MAG: TonB-dependent receptor [Acidobacteria bacterium]|nr:TonB-dependent receptor [Acidobacteriota bacterium]
MTARRLVSPVLWGVLVLPSTLWAQAATGSIAGLVRDTSGAVLPGVTVEAASPALIEKVRTVVTDAAGAYRIVELRPGAYTVTFSLPGFATVRREGIELTTSFTATVNADLRVGGVEETITVTGETPVVDISSARQQTTVSREVLDAIPTTKRLGQYASFIPGATYRNPTFQDSGGTAGEGGQFGVHGQRWRDQIVNMEGLNQNIFGLDVYSYNSQTIQEVVVETGGTSAEAMTGGVQLNIIPKDGGNNWSGSFSSSWAGPSLQADNLNDDLRARGLRAGASIKQFKDNGGAFGGPIAPDRLWFFTAHRYWGTQKYVQGTYFNKSPNKLFYVPDFDNVAHTNWYYHDNNIRLTWQATARNKVALFYSHEDSCNCPVGLSGIGGANAVKGTPESLPKHLFNPLQNAVVSWSSPVTDKLLVEGAASFQGLNVQTEPIEGVSRNAIGITDVGLGLEYGGLAGGGNPGGNTFYGTTQRRDVRRYTGRAAVSYVTGSHTLKSGFVMLRYNLGREGAHTDPDAIAGGRAYVFRNQVPIQVRLWAVPYELVEHWTNFGAYAQDQWVVRKLTLNLGLRYDSFLGTVPAHRLPAGYFVPAREFPAADNVPNYKNLDPRLSATYDLFGNGKTALKASIGRYIPWVTATIGNPQSGQPAFTTVTWNDSFYGPGDPRTGNVVPDCDLRNVSGSGECGPWADRGFGQVRMGTRFDEDAIDGFNKQLYNWQSSVSLQQELRPGMALNVGYFRTWYGNFLVTDNRATTAADYDPFCVTLPATDSRLPGAGQQRCGFFDVKPSLFGRVDNFRTRASNYGRRSDVYNGVDVTLTARFAQGGQFSGGLNVGRAVTDTCELAAKIPEALFGADSTLGAENVGPGTLPTGVAGSWSSLLDCKVTPPWSADTQVKFLFVYPLPWDLQFSAIYQNFPGVPVTATWAVNNAIAGPSLGRNIAACGANCAPTSTFGQVELISPGVAYEDRQQQVDLRFTRRFRIGRASLRPSLDLSNILNAGSIYAANTGFGSQWLVPYEISGGRLARINFQLEF